MRILFENYEYNKKSIENIVPEWMLRIGNNTDSVILPYVGYFWSHAAGDIVYFLPKIFIDDKGIAFGSILPEQFLSPTNYISLNNSALSKRLYCLSLWIYESIRVYRDNSKDYDVKLFEENSAKSVISYKKGKQSHTMMELYFSFIDFYRENKNIFIRKNFSSNRGDNVNWHKTVNKVSPFIQDNNPFYLAPKTTVSRVDYDEELLSMFFSVLEYFRENFGCKIAVDCGYNLIKGHHFLTLLSGKGIRKLKLIKNRYYSDVFVKLWKLLYEFFDLYSNISLCHDYEEALLTNNYPIVFESMIDSLIGDDGSKSDIPRYYKDQKDGKIIDHIYRESDLFSDDEIYFIGDSKYYKSGAYAMGASVEKQFTYAKNVIQYSTDPYLLHSQRRLRYRDEVTEGYNITPNFFISAVVDDKYDASKDNIKNIGKPEFSCQFKNRLFDRDTLSVHRYSINFLFVLAAYISKDHYIKNNFKKRARRKFREDIILYINDRYQLFRIYHDIFSTNEQIINSNFRRFCGQMYSLKDEDKFFILAYDREFIQENTKLSVNDELEKIQNELMKIEGVEQVVPYKLPL